MLDGIISMGISSSSILLDGTVSKILLHLVHYHKLIK